MDYWHILMYVVVAVPLLALGETIWRRQWGDITDHLLNVGVFSGLFLMIYPPSALRGAGPFLAGMVVVLLAVLAVRWYGPWRKHPGANSGPPSA